MPNPTDNNDHLMIDARGNDDVVLEQELKSKLTIGDQSNPIDEVGFAPHLFVNS